MTYKLLAAGTVFLAFATQAHAESDSISLVSDDHQVVVVVEGVVPRTTRVVDRADRLEVLLAEPPDELQKRLVRDGTVKRVDLVDGPPARLSIKLHHGRTVTQLMAQQATVTYKNGTLRVTIPRKHWLSTEPLRRRTKKRAAPAVEQEHEVITVQPAADDRAVVDAPKREERESGTGTVVPTNKPESAAKLPPAPKQERDDHAKAKPTARDIDTAGPLGATRSEAPAAPFHLGEPAPDHGSTSGLGAVFIALVLLLGGAVWWVVNRQRRNKTPSEQSLRILSARTVAGKARVVLLAANNREFLLSVTDKGARVLGRWRTPAQQPAHVPGRFLPEEVGLYPTLSTPNARTADLAAGGPAHAERTLDAEAPSPAVTGILRLRENMPFVADDVASENSEDDAVWARELFAATSRGQR